MFYQVLGVLLAILLISGSLRAWQTGELKTRRRGRLRQSEYPFLFHSMLAIRLILGGAALAVDERSDSARLVQA